MIGTLHDAACGVSEWYCYQSHWLLYESYILAEDTASGDGRGGASTSSSRLMFSGAGHWDTALYDV